MAASSLTGSVDKLQVVEYLRANAGIHGALADSGIDNQQCEVVFKGPGYPLQRTRRPGDRPVRT